IFFSQLSFSLGHCGAGSKYLRTVLRESLSTRAMLRIECPCSDMILICACIRTLVLSLAINWFLLQLAKVASFVASLRKRRVPPEMGWVHSLISGGSLRGNGVGPYAE